MAKLRVPFADLGAQYASIKPQVDAAIAEVIRESAFVRGRFVDQFEHDFAAAIGVPHCVSCANGTDALHIAMHALGVLPGDEVIVPAHSWISTSAMVTATGASVVFCDTDARTYTLDPVQLESKISPRTVGIIPVHLYGQPADMGSIMAIATRHRLWVLEDCAQSHLASYNGKQVGTFGAAASYSFYPGKNLGAMGDAGALVTNDAELAERMARFSRHGGLVKGEHSIEGINSRLDGLQAAILSAKLPYLREWTRRRQAVAVEYDRALAGIARLASPLVAAGREHVYHLYVIAHETRDELVKHLTAAGVQTVINYPVALPFLPAYARLGHRPEDFPNAYRNQGRVVSLPMFPEISGEQIAAVVDAIKGFNA